MTHNRMVNNMTLLNDESQKSSSGNPRFREKKGEAISPSLQLPIPEQTDLERSDALLKLIFSEIKRNGGSISFKDYMKLVLYTPRLGYYSGQATKFGEKGDFVTAPEISPLFSYCLANQCHEVLETLNNRNLNTDILEIGAGTGQMAIDILVKLNELGCLPLHYYILEISPVLQERQKQKMALALALAPQIFSKIVWLDKLPDTPFNGVILANEVLDAMPVHCFNVSEGQWFDLAVTEKDGQLSFKKMVSAPHPYLTEFLDASDVSLNYSSEINAELNTWISDLEGTLETGAIILIDYGFPNHEYYHPDRLMGTLMCHYRHIAHHDPFLYPGLQDITTHVDFTSVAMAAHAANLEVLGFTNQASFLLSLRLLDMLIPPKEMDPVAVTYHLDQQSHREQQFIRQNYAVQLLTSSAEMGELIKVIALGKNFDESLTGFSLNDMRYRL